MDLKAPEAKSFYTNVFTRNRELDCEENLTTVSRSLPSPSTTPPVGAKSFYTNVFTRNRELDCEENLTTVSRSLPSPSTTPPVGGEGTYDDSGDYLLLFPSMNLSQWKNTNDTFTTVLLAYYCKSYKVH
uniref:Uncharacterized protein n=1 Tax=Glossina austeni TaxID=7395 RepID=A0A1A9VV13_GLOAU